MVFFIEKRRPDSFLERQNTLIEKVSTIFVMANFYLLLRFLLTFQNTLILICYMYEKFVNFQMYFKNTFR
jgi:hypothetical protein